MTVAQIPDLQNLLLLEVKAFDELNMLWHDIQQASQLNRHGQSGLLSHLWYAKAKLRDLRQITSRVCEQLPQWLELTRLSDQERENQQFGFSQAATDAGRIAGYLQIDFEVAYQFATILLDQLAVSTTLIGGRSANGVNFNSFTNQTSSRHKKTSIGTEVVTTLKSQTTWIHAHVLTYRDNFLTHYEDPWQRGTIWYFNPLDLSLMASLAPDWAGKDRVEACERDIVQFALKTPNGPTGSYDASNLHLHMQNPRYSFSRMMWSIDEFDESEQAELVRIAKIFGFTSPPFKLLMQRIFEYVEQWSKILRAYVPDNIENINLRTDGGVSTPYPFPTTPETEPYIKKFLI